MKISYKFVIKPVFVILIHTMIYGVPPEYIIKERLYIHGVQRRVSIDLLWITCLRYSLVEGTQHTA